MAKQKIKKYIWFLAAMFLFIGLTRAVFVRAAWEKEGVFLGEGKIKNFNFQGKNLIVPDKQGGIIYLYSVDEEINNKKVNSLYAQKLNSKGEKVWGEKGVLVNRPNDELEFMDYQQIISDGFDGAIVTFVSKYKNYVQRINRINKYGQKKWGKTGKLIGPISWGSPSIVSNKKGSATISVYVYGKDNYVLVEKLNYQGKVLWKNLLRELSVSFKSIESIITDKKDNIYILGYTPSAEANFYKINSQGKILWSIKQLSPNFYVNSKMVLSEDGIIIVGHRWDEKNSTFKEDLYAQKIDWYGNLRWSKQGVKVSDFTNQVLGKFKIVSDKKGGVIVVWVDKRVNKNGDIYAQRLNQRGKIMWGKNDKLISSSLPLNTSKGIISVNQQGMMIPPANGDLEAISDKQGGMIISWLKNGYINVKRINRKGKLLWKNELVGRKSDFFGLFDYQMPIMTSKKEIVIIAQSRTGNLYAYKIDQKGRIVEE